MEQQKVQNYKDDEIDLIELVSLLWKKKLTILIITTICVLIAAGYAFTAKERWTSKAVVLTPTTISLEKYLNIRREYQRILGGNLDTHVIANNLFSKFNEQLYSLDNRENFFSTAKVYQYEVTKITDEKTKKEILNDLVTKDIVVSKPDLKKDPDTIGLSISFSAQTPNLAQTTLKQFIKSISQQAFAFNLASFLIEYNETISNLKFEKDKIERNLKAQKQVRLENLGKALEIAKEANIKNFSREVNDTSDLSVLALARSDTTISLSDDSRLGDNTYLFMLGEKYLKAQLDITNQTKIIYPPRYYEIQTQLDQLEQLAQKLKNIKEDAFTYLSSPDYPVVKDRPNRIIILIIGLCLGLVVSICIIIMTKILNRYKKND